ncbi:MAG: UDP-3-O-acyl-N-acetylglucosamine deacetylase [Paludibacteraceae bacterium]|nr:UDP-3-O-acyl-N-acetylglucosamine deacetylase [Paludibacteraceae bacterium]
MNQHTIQKPFTLEGKGLHTGLQITANFIPAPADSGINFVRVDLDGRPVIEALANNVANTERGTVIKKGDASISTIEHTMAALIANGIDNCTIEVNAPEVPILDGSAIIISNAIKKAGIEEQNAERKYLEINKTQYFKFPNGSEFAVFPADKFSIESTVDFNSPVLAKQTAVLSDIDNFDREIAAARTFVFVREIEPLLKMGLIKGGDLDNAIVIYDQPMPQEAINNLTNLLGVKDVNTDSLGYLNKRPLAWDNEPARHKLLDIIGDLYLVGKPIKGKITALKPGHGVNTQVAKALFNL